MSEYVKEELEPDRRRRVEAHVEFCPRCRAVLANLRQTLVASARSAAPRTLGPTTPTRSPSGSAAPGEGAASVGADEAAA
jgi:anti-sigma factor RsiW